MFHQSTYRKKREERQARIDALPAYKELLTDTETSLLRLSAESAAAKVREGLTSPLELLKAYGKQALKVHNRLNVVTEVMIKDAETWAQAPGLKDKPLAGFPISMKDTLAVKGYDSTIGYAKNCFKPLSYDSPLIKLLKDAGGVPFIKSNVPYTMLSFECYNDVWGVSENPAKKGFVPGGSTGGEAALLASGGSRLGIGTDVAGSVRLPAHFSGCYSLKCSIGRFPKAGNVTSMPGQEGIPSVYSPMTSSMADLSYFLKTIIQMKPWNYDYSCHRIPWDDSVKLPAKCKVGVMSTDGIVDPTPACKRALDLTVDALKKQGHEVVEFSAPSPLRALRIASQLLCSDGVEVALRKQVFGEKNDLGVERISRAMRWPKFVMRWYAWFLENVIGDSVWATLVRDWHVKSITERWDLVYERESYKAEFFDAWNDQGIDFLVTVPNASPAFRHGGLYDSISSCNYTFLFNLLDYAAGVLPVTRVDKAQDSLGPEVKVSKLNRVARGAYKLYDAADMHGLSVGIQVVAPRLEEEKALLAMQLVEDALHSNDVYYEDLPL